MHEGIVLSCPHTSLPTWDSYEQQSVIADPKCFIQLNRQSSRQSLVDSHSEWFEEGESSQRRLVLRETLQFGDVELAYGTLWFKDDKVTLFEAYAQNGRSAEKQLGEQIRKHKELVESAPSMLETVLGKLGLKALPIRKWKIENFELKVCAGPDPVDLVLIVTWRHQER